MTSCPCCGSEVSRPVIVSLETNVVSTAAGSAKVPPQCAEVVAALLRRYPSVVSFENLGVAIWGDRYFDVNPTTLQKRVWQARQPIASLGLTIKNVFGTGYRLSTSKTEGA